MADTQTAHGCSVSSDSARRNMKNGPTFHEDLNCGRQLTWKSHHSPGVEYHCEGVRAACPTCHSRPRGFPEIPAASNRSYVVPQAAKRRITGSAIDSERDKRSFLTSTASNGWMRLRPMAKRRFATGENPGGGSR